MQSNYWNTVIENQEWEEKQMKKTELTELLKVAFNVPDDNYTLEGVYLEAIIRVVMDDDDFTAKGQLALVRDLANEYWKKSDEEYERV